MFRITPHLSRRFKETSKFPIEFPISSSFCLGEPAGFRKFLRVLLVYSSFCHLHFNHSQVLEINDVKPDYIYRAFAGSSRFVCCLLAPVFQTFHRHV